MTHKHAAAFAQHGAELISRMLKTGKIPASERSEACDIAIDLNLLAQHHSDQIPDPDPKPAKKP